MRFRYINYVVNKPYVLTIWLSIMWLCVTLFLKNGVVPEKIEDPLAQAEEINVFIQNSIDENQETNIVGGFLARDGQFPYQVSIQKVVNAFHYMHTCGGSIIGVQHVLSAAHCFPRGIKPEQYIVKAGSVSLKKTSLQSTKIEDIILHPRYQSIVDGYDVAVLKVVSSYTFGKFINLIKISQSAINSTDYCVSTGWGADFDKDISTILKGLIMQIGNTSYCRKHIRYVHKTVFCAGGVIREDTCVGDSGGPLVCDGKQFGIVSFGSQLCGEGTPTFFTNVTALNDWITNAMTNEGNKIQFHHNILIILPNFIFIFLPMIKLHS